METELRAIKSAARRRRAESAPGEYLIDETTDIPGEILSTLRKGGTVRLECHAYEIDASLLMLWKIKRALETQRLS